MYKYQIKKTALSTNEFLKKKKPICNTKTQKKIHTSNVFKLESYIDQTETNK